MTRLEQELLPNPERFWKPQAGLGEATRADIESRIGAFAGPCTPLSGGLANANVLVDGVPTKSANFMDAVAPRAQKIVQSSLSH